LIDGIKIDVNSLNGSKWLSNKLLHFHTYTSVETGELLDGTIVAKYKGLKFFIIQSKKYENRVYYSVRGSLHKYFNNGNHNANDFNFNDLQKVLQELEQKFNINPKTSTLRNLEFGVNINTPIEAKEVLKNLVCFGKYTFGTLKIAGLNVGKRIQKQQSSLKIYNKGKQYQKATNLVRFEIAIHKMLYLKKYSIVMLSDLQNINKIKPLEVLLLSYWDSVIYYDKAIDWKRLTEFERKKVLYYATPRNWSDFEIKQRYRAKKHFKKLMQQFSSSTTHKEIYTLIGSKWSDLSANICPQINHKLNPKIKSQNVHKLTVSIQGYSMDKTPPKKENIKTIKNQPKKPLIMRVKKCKVCSSDISQKRDYTKFCSKKCNNHFHGKERTKRNQQKRNLEKEKLKELLKVLPQNKLWLWVAYRMDIANYSDYLHQSEINTTKEIIKKVQQVSVKGYKGNTQPVILNSYRARTLISKINILNS
jgi:hypothetical protein